MTDPIAKFMEEIKPCLIEERRRRHRYPEVGFTEYVTTYELGERLKGKGFNLYFGHDALVSEERMGVPAAEVLESNERRALEYGVPEQSLDLMTGGHTGLVAVLDTQKPGPHFAYRFDIDALPVKESDEAGHLPKDQGFSSAIPGLMHACGHDGHSAIGIGLADFLAERKEQLTGKFTLLFQPAEEGGRGAKAMVEKGWLDDVDYFLSGHLGLHSLEAGTVAASTTKFLASSKMDAKFTGKAAHSGLEPNEGRNALLAAASAALHLHSIPRHKDGATRINVGTMHAGSGRNIIPGEAVMEIETRGETDRLNAYMEEHAVRMLQASATLYDVELSLKPMGKALTAEGDAEFAKDIARACEGSASVKIIPELTIGASEDVTYMIERVRQQGGKAAFMVFASPLPAGHHHPRFDFDELALSAGLETLLRTTLELMKGA